MANHPTDRSIERANVAERVLQDLEKLPLADAPEPERKSAGELIIEATIGHVDKATEIVLEMLDKLEVELNHTREVLQKSKLHLHDTLRHHMIISETAMRSAQHIAEQLVEHASTLAKKNGQPT